MYQFDDDPRNTRPEDIIPANKTIPFYDMEELKQFPFTSHLCFDYQKDKRSMKSTFTIDWANLIIWAFIILIASAMCVFGYFVACGIWDKIIN